MSLIIYAPASILFVMTRREQRRRLFSPGELFVPAVSVIGAIVDIVALATGWITVCALTPTTTTHVTLHGRGTS